MTQLIGIAGWFEEQEPDCKTPMVCQSQIWRTWPKILFPESEVDTADEARACQVYADCGAAGHVFTGFDSCE